MPRTISSLCIVGPTASGKTALALALAQNLPMEIISMDSALVYRGMDIGTAKPSAAELAQVPHHLIDIIDPTEVYSAAQFATSARQLIVDIHQRGNLAVCVGGTMLYLRALIHGLADLPAANPQLRTYLEEEAKRKGWPAMHAELMTVDPHTAARLTPNDSQRIQRALEIYHSSGKNMSTWLAEQQHSTTTDEHAALQFHTWAYQIEHRAWLHQRIEQRFVQMLHTGLIEEVQGLRRRYPKLTAHSPSMRCVGYRQVWDFLEEPTDWDTLCIRGTVATRQLAKRQMTWLRHHVQAERWLRPGEEDLSALQEDAEQWLA